jgi:MraZ protein
VGYSFYFTIMSNYLGEFEVTVDPKGMFIIPAGYKRQMLDKDGERFVLSRGFDKCLTLYTENQWKKVEAYVSNLNEFNEKARTFKRNFLNGATKLEPDTAGRLLIPKSMMEYASIAKDMIFSAQMDKVELWDATAYRKHTTISSEDMNSLANEVLGGDFSLPKLG